MIISKEINLAFETPISNHLSEMQIYIVFQLDQTMIFVLLRIRSTPLMARK